MAGPFGEFFNIPVVISKVNIIIIQFNTVVTITRCVHRSFGPDQWKGLQSRLKALRISVAGVLESAKKYNN